MLWKQVDISGFGILFVAFVLHQLWFKISVWGRALSQIFYQFLSDLFYLFEVTCVSSSWTYEEKVMAVGILS